ncbi:hypothetical protein [Flavobacterium aestuarii]|uniref:hypothetical protein n=1 Tax=Flavobacterium aestuarii TaxID=3149227 RepID=UPI0032B51AEB
MNTSNQKNSTAQNNNDYKELPEINPINNFNNETKENDDPDEEIITNDQEEDVITNDEENLDRDLLNPSEEIDRKIDEDDPLIHLKKL